MTERVGIRVPLFQLDFPGGIARAECDAGISQVGDKPLHVQVLLCITWK